MSINFTHNQLGSLTSKRLSRLHGFYSWWFVMYVVAIILVGLICHFMLKAP